jgi:hypothetical protein
MQAVFGGKVGHGMFVVRRKRRQQMARLGLHIFLKHIHDIIVPANILGIGAGLFQKLAGKLPEHLVRVVAALLPGLPVEGLEEHACARVPAPPEVFRQFLQAGKAFRQMGKQWFCGMRCFP